jgi:hypothetical protein
MSRVLFIQADSRTLNPTLEQEQIDAAYQSDPAVARAEWGGEFRADISAYLSDALIDASLPGRLKAGTPLASVAFCDMSGGIVDASVLAIAHAETVEGALVVILDRLQIVDSPHEPAAAVAQFCETLKRYGLNRVTGDRYSAGWVIGAFNERGIHYQQCELDKNSLYNECAALFAERRVQLLEDARLLTELRLLERRPRIGGRPDSIDHGPRGHDDASNAACGALWLALEQSKGADRPDSLIRTSMLLAAANTDDTSRAPIELPAQVAGVFASACAGAGAHVDTVGTIYFAFQNELTGDPPRLLLIDWDLREVGGGGLEAWLPWTLERLKQLQESFPFCRSSFGLLVEPSGSGEVICAQAWRNGLEQVHLPENERLLAMDFAQRAAGAAAHVNLGDVRIARYAYEKTVTVKNVAVNHLLRQLAFGINQPAREAGALLIAFSNGTLYGFGDFEQ